ncbi:MAG TPA: hypothetical protein VFJ05_03650 [Nitrososphaeraceae archaeon]|nr:hypothetical protein [Nitrososphaeraceae archaeon]
MQHKGDLRRIPSLSNEDDNEFKESYYDDNRERKNKKEEKKLESSSSNLTRNKESKELDYNEVRETEIEQEKENGNYVYNKTYWFKYHIIIKKITVSNNI